jgi:hypothetical protein
MIPDEPRSRPSTKRSRSSGSAGPTSGSVVADAQQQGKERKEASAEKCTGPHTRACDALHAGQPYQFFSAAFAGCYRCVRRYIEDGGDPAVSSQSGRHNALDWANFGKHERQSTDRVIGFLQGLGVKGKRCDNTMDAGEEPTEEPPRRETDNSPQVPLTTSKAPPAAPSARWYHREDPRAATSQRSPPDRT